MESIQLDENLSIKKLNPSEEKDIWLVNELDKDELISGENGYLYPINRVFKNTRYLFDEDIYQSPYGIYDKQKPIGYLELSNILYSGNKKCVEISYALLERERGKGYATKTLLEVTKKILMDSKKNIDQVILLIDEENRTSQRVAERAGFIMDSTTLHFDDMLGYAKTKRMLQK